MLGHLLSKSPKLNKRNSRSIRQPRREPVERAAGRAIEELEGRVLLSVVNTLVDPFTGSGVDYTKWTATTRGLEANAPAGYDAPSEDANGLVLGGSPTAQYWYGNSLESVDDFSSQATTTISVDRASLAGTGTSWRSSLWILQPNGKFVHFSQNANEPSGWSYNANFVGSTVVTGGGAPINFFNNIAPGGGDHVMKLVYTPGADQTADVGIYLDGTLGDTVHFTNWDHTVPFKVILTGQARATGDTVSAVFKDLNATAEPIPTDPPAAPSNVTATAPANGTAVTLSWLDNANNEVNYRVERSADGVNFTEIATVPAIAASGGTGTYTDHAPGANTSFYYRVRAFNTANGTSYSDYAAANPITTPPAIASLVDPLTGNGVDTTKWNITNRGLEANAPAGFNAPVEDATGLTLSGTSTSSYWYGSSLESKNVFNSQAKTTVTVDRVSVDGTGIFRSSLWLLQPSAGGQYLHFSQNVNESKWQFNQTSTGVGTEITAFDAVDQGDHVMKLVYTPLGGSNATVDIYLDDVLGATATYTNWDNTAPFEVILSGMARMAGDSVTAHFTNFSATSELPPIPPAAPTHLTATKGSTGVDLMFTDNSDSELNFSIERSTDGTNFTPIASLPPSLGTGASVSYTDTTATNGTYFYRVRGFNYFALGTYSQASNPAVVSVAPTIITSLIDPLTQDTLDTTNWTPTNRGLENTGEAGFSYFITSSGLFFNGVATNQYWYGSSIESNGQFASTAQTTVEVDRVFLAGDGPVNGGNYRSSLWLLQPGGQFLHFAQDVGETGWEYNQTIGNSGVAIDSFNTAAPDLGEHIMKLVYTPLGGTNATVDIYLDGNLGATATFDNWDNSVPFKVILSGMARATNDSMQTDFMNFSAVSTPTVPTVISGTGNADNFYIKKNADGINDDVWINSGTPGVGAPTTQVLIAQLAGLEFDGLGGNDLLTVDYSAGNPVPLSGLNFVGGADTDTLKIIGASATDAFGMGSIGVNHAGGGTLSQTDVENVAIASGIYTIDVQAVTSGSISSLDVDSGATVRVIYPDAPAGDPNTALIVAAIRSFLVSGYNGGTWTGEGINSSDAATHSGFSLGYVNDPTQDTFTIKYTLSGDVNLDGIVGFADLVAVAQHYGLNDPNLGWTQGDVTYDGQIAFADLVAVAQNYGKTLPTTPAPAALPPSAPVASEAPAPAAVVSTPPVITTPVVTVPVTVPPVVVPPAAKPPVITAGKGITPPAAAVNLTTKPPVVTKPQPAAQPTPFATKATLPTLSRSKAADTDVLSKKPATSVFA
jgi:hypothetical protein